ncbi:unnamed protein product [Discula destructiva]
MAAFSQAGSAPVPVPCQFLADPPADQLPRLRRKRKADTHDANNERLNKRMSLLNLEQNGPKLYVPVEQSQLPSIISHSSSTNIPDPFSTQPALTTAAAVTDTTTTTAPADEPMHLDDTKHKVYIYNLDDELSSSSDSEDNPAAAAEARLVLLPDLAAHLRANRLRIPRPIPLLPPHPSDEDDHRQAVVLYQPDGPPSLSVPAEQDGVRRAIVAARERVRERQALERSAVRASLAGPRPGGSPRTVSFATPVKFAPRLAGEREAEMVVDEQAGGSSSAAAAAIGAAVPTVVGSFDGGSEAGYDPDAMDID